MISGDLVRIAAVLKGELKGDKRFENKAFRGISTDTRTIKPGNLFFALDGENFRGADFAETALSKGAVAVVVSNKSDVSRFSPVILVEDTVIALGDAARWWRNRFEGTVIAVSGSAGKTLTRSAIQRTLSSCLNVHGTSGNLNNHIGVPLTLAGLDLKKHQAAVIEAGMNHAGELEYLGGIIKPDLVILTNVGAAHLEGLGSMKAVCEAKLELLKSEPEAFIYNHDDIRLRRAAYNYKGKKIPCTLKKKATYDSQAMPEICIKSGEKDYFCRPGVPGVPGAMSALFAAAVAEYLQLDPDIWTSALNNINGEKLRLNLIDLADRVFMEDCYNANPLSMKTALETVSLVESSGKAACLGDMLELGRYSRRFHKNIGKYVAELGYKTLVTFGDRAEDIGMAASNRGVKWHHAKKHSEAASVLLKYTDPGDIILIKGSRLMALEKVIDAIRTTWMKG